MKMGLEPMTSRVTPGALPLSYFRKGWSGRTETNRL